MSVHLRISVDHARVTSVLIVSLFRILKYIRMGFVVLPVFSSQSYHLRPYRRIPT